MLGLSAESVHPLKADCNPLQREEAQRGGSGASVAGRPSEPAGKHVTPSCWAKKKGGPEEPPALTFANAPQKDAYVDCDIGH